MRLDIRSTLSRIGKWFIWLMPILLLTVALCTDLGKSDSDHKLSSIRVGLLLVGSTILGLIISWRAVLILEARLLVRFRSIEFMKHDALSIPTLTKAKPPSLTGRLYLHRKPSRSLFLLPSWAGPARPMSQWIALLLLFIALELIFVFLISIGQWTKWPHKTQYYDLLAQSFSRGEVSLPVSPSPLLAELANPYDPTARRDIPIMFDASYYHGKYYMYWGPAPAAVVFLLKTVTGASFGDEHILFAATNIILVFSALILLWLKRKFYPSIPSWLILVSISLVATVHPMLWVLNLPSIYEAAIACGQAFLLSGFYFAIPAIVGDERQIWRLTLVGILWAFALASRLTLVITVAVMCIALLHSLVSGQTRQRGWLDALVRSTVLLTPVLISITLLALYNYARFGSVLETGLRFQLSKLNYEHVISQGGLFNLKYLLPNIGYYMFAPMTFRSTFPFVRPLFGQLARVSPLLQEIQVPYIYHVENVSGLLFSIPAVPLTGFLAYVIIRGKSLPDPFSHALHPNDLGLLRLPLFTKILHVTLLAAFAAAIPTLLYFWVSNRFLLDSVPLLSIAIAGSGWRAYSASRSNPVRRVYAASFIVLAISISALVSFLLAMTGSWSQFDDINPALWNAISQFFTR